jgi:hypothetical protein
MASTPIHISFGEMFKVLVHEFKDALAIVKRSHPSITVRSVKMNIGQLDDVSPEENDEKAPPQTDLILKDRYPGIDKGWQLELEMGERPSASLNGIPQRPSNIYIPTALDYFSECPLGIIKGIDTQWTQFFASFEIYRVRHLARMDGQTLQKINAEKKSLKPCEFRHKAGLLDTPIPTLPESILNEKSLFNLLLFPRNDAHQALGTERVTSSEVAALYDLLEKLNLAIDTHIFHQTNLSQLLELWN